MCEIVMLLGLHTGCTRNARRGFVELETRQRRHLACWGGWRYIYRCGCQEDIPLQPQEYEQARAVDTKVSVHTTKHITFAQHSIEVHWCYFMAMVSISSRYPRITCICNKMVRPWYSYFHPESCACPKHIPSSCHRQESCR